MQPVGPGSYGPPCAMAPMGPPGMELGVPLSAEPAGPWAPPGTSQPWPRDEYLRDGGVLGPVPTVGANKEVRGLDMEDAVARFDTREGQTLVEPSNKVYVYSPRFGAVRQISNLAENEQTNASVGVHQPTGLVNCDEVDRFSSAKQNFQARREIGTGVPIAYRSRQQGDFVSSMLGPKGFVNSFKPFEDFTVIRTGMLIESEMAVLAKATAAAVAWSRDESVQVVLDRKAAQSLVNPEQSETVYTIKQPPGHPQLRVIKVASTQTASPGEKIDFTIRFDNTGDEPLANVAILDNLSTRLEFVAGSAQSSVPAQFSTQPNAHGSLVLRWEVATTLAPGKGGIVRFTCRVR